MTVNFSTDEIGAQRIVSEIIRDGGRAIAVQANVAKRSDVQRLFAKATESFGRVDILVNNAGVSSFRTLHSSSEQEFDRLFHTNTLGVLLASQEALKHFGPNGGRIINIGTAGTQAVNPGTVVYVATKGRAGLHHPRARKGTGLTQDPGKLDPSGRRRDRGIACARLHRQRL